MLLFGPLLHPKCQIPQFNHYVKLVSKPSAVTVDLLMVEWGFLVEKPAKQHKGSHPLTMHLS